MLEKQRKERFPPVINSPKAVVNLAQLVWGRMKGIENRLFVVLKIKKEWEIYLRAEGRNHWEQVKHPSLMPTKGNSARWLNLLSQLRISFCECCIKGVLPC